MVDEFSVDELIDVMGVAMDVLVGVAMLVVMGVVTAKGDVIGTDLLLIGICGMSLSSGKGLSLYNR